MIEVECPKCGKRHTVYDATASVVARCGQYRDVVIVPAKTILFASADRPLGTALRRR
jgi:ribosomal protein S27E